MSRRKRKRNRPVPSRTPQVQDVTEEPGAAMPATDAPSVRALLRERFGLVVRETAQFEEDRVEEAEEVLALLLEALQGGRMDDSLRAEFDMRLISVGLEVAVDDDDLDDGPADEETEEAAAARIAEELAEIGSEGRTEDKVVSDDYGDEDLLQPQPEIELPALERGPLAAGIQILEAMLAEAKGGYIAAQIDALEMAIHENFSPQERAMMAEAAAQWRDDANLPDVPGAYRALVVHRAASSEGG